MQQSLYSVVWKEVIPRHMYIDKTMGKEKIEPFKPLNLSKLTRRLNFNDQIIVAEEDGPLRVQI